MGFEPTISRSLKPVPLPIWIPTRAECGRGDSNPQWLSPLVPQTRPYTNSETTAKGVHGVGLEPTMSACSTVSETAPYTDSDTRADAPLDCRDRSERSRKVMASPGVEPGPPRLQRGALHHDSLPAIPLQTSAAGGIRTLTQTAPKAVASTDWATAATAPRWSRSGEHGPAERSLKNRSWLAADPSLGRWRREVAIARQRGSRGCSGPTGRR